MKTAFLILAGLILIAWWIDAYSVMWSYRRRELDRERQSNNLRHITGTKRWWGNSPDDGPEGDH